MKVHESVQKFRRKTMFLLTQNIGRSKSYSIPDSNKVKRILISRPNHRLGNLLLLTPLLQEIGQTFPDAKIDLFVKGGIAPTLFGNYANVDRIIMLPKRPFSSLLPYLSRWFQLRFRKYDLAINVDPKSSSGRLSTKFANAKYKCFGDSCPKIQLAVPDSNHIAKIPVYNLRRNWANCPTQLSEREMPCLDLRLTHEELAKGEQILKAGVKNDKKTIVIFTYATGRKCYDNEWWEKFYSELKLRYPDFNILEILPAENISAINHKADTILSHNVREIASIISASEVFIGADSGIMHLASAAKTRTMGLFSITDATKYAPYNANSLAINTNKSSFQEWFTALDTMLGVSCTSTPKFPAVAM